MDFHPKIPNHQMITTKQVMYLEQVIAQFNAPLQPLQEFILPGGTRAASLAHLARAISRRAERTIIVLGQNETVYVPLRQYMNRLSDLLFIVARCLNQEAKLADVLWKKNE